ncbi:MAG: NAD(P)H-dependent oxidoreductase [Bacteroidota bacterium]
MKKQLNGVIILGSSRANGNTAKVVVQLSEIGQFSIINLLDYNITRFDYDHSNSKDDYIPLIKEVTENYNLIIFATPVYWYAMSGIMKNFFDRFTDLLKVEKELGRRLRGKYMAAISSANSENLGEDFWLPFQKTAAYLGMTYTTDLHTYEGKLFKKDLESFYTRLEELVND